MISARRQTAPSNQKKLRKPAIVLTKTDHKRLLLLAERFAEQNAGLADFLLSELERARIVEDERIATDVVRLPPKCGKDIEASA
ncbi:hypothetical protein JET14_20695 (plasmid) [Martelella lutilitoris]|uniref:Regulator of nucleoside diphosphate kinase N-terminal domain-containing protein n=1 Tax=Martelella lutilitoris TaxID=2583532 RepID=A0A7T7HPE2_9HYPH|nr:hypothetical protein [Martelella lutilitoris]QQM32936.1 hypothetical protein JET14_20695 [Martelella lutilitoris]QRX65037.1 hypothetical protein JS578_13250 [Dysgonomonadaceae bacterium zrk40]